MVKPDPEPFVERYPFDDHEGTAPKAYVPGTYQGTANDRREMSMLGKKQVLRRNFRFVGMLGFASTVSKSKVLLYDFQRPY